MLYAASPIATAFTIRKVLCLVGVWIVVAAGARSQTAEPIGPPVEPPGTSETDRLPTPAVKAGDPLQSPRRPTTPDGKSWAPLSLPPELGPEPDQAPDPPPSPAPDSTESEQDQTEEKRKGLLRRKLEKWDGEFSAGVDGSQGNTELVRVRGGVRLSRRWTRDRLQIQADYRFARDARGERENRLDSLVRHERTAGDNGRFGYFTEVDADTDSSLDFDARVRLNTGPTYWWVRNPKAELRSSAGLAITREFGAPDSEYIPEFTAEIRGERDVTERMKLIGSVRYDPEVEALSKYRLRTRAAAEYLIDPELRLSLRLEVENRFDSDPAGAQTQQNDLDYAARLVWRF